MNFLLFWILCVVGTYIVAEHKSLGGLEYGILALFLGPLAFLIALISPARTKQLPADDYAKINFNLQDEINDLKNKVHFIQSRIKRLEELHSKDAKEEKKSTETPQEGIEKIDAPLAKKMMDKFSGKKIKFKDKEGLELKFGKFWLNKIGIVVFMLGIGSLISYSVQHFNLLSSPIARVLFGFVLSGGLFYLGAKFETHKKYRNFGYALLGGAWALTYFTTFAMHHIEAARIISNQFLDVCLLFVVAAGMIKHALKYKSEEITSMALLMAYITSTLSDITAFSFISLLIISVIMLILTYRFSWHRMFTIGVGIVYVIHQFWITPKLYNDQVMNIIFLSVYWLIFVLGIHIRKSLSEDKNKYILAGINVANFLLYSLFAYPIVATEFYAHKFLPVLLAGLFYIFLAVCSKKIKKDELYIGNMAMGIFAVTMCIPLKYSTQSSILMWLIEIPLLVFIGYAYRQYLFRACAYALTVYSAFYFCFNELFFYRSGTIHVWNILLTWNQFIALMTAVCMTIAFIFGAKFKEQNRHDYGDLFFNHVFSLLSFLSLNIFIFDYFSPVPLQIILTLEILGVYLVGSLFQYRRYNIYAYGLMAILLSKITFTQHVLSDFQNWSLIIFEVSVFYVLYYLAKSYFPSEKNKHTDNVELIALLTAGAYALVVFLYQHLNPDLLSLAFGFFSVAHLILGLWIKDRYIRMAGIGVLVLTMMRVFFVDLAHLDIIYKIISFIILGVLFLGVSFVYNKLDVKVKDD